MEEKNIDNKKVRLGTVVLLIMLSFGIFYATEKTGNTNVKLYIQEQLGLYFTSGQTAKYFSYILVMTRIFRVLMNMVFFKVYGRVKEKIGYYFPILYIGAFLAVIAGSLIPTILIKFLLMSLGFCIVIGIRDTFNTYIHDLILKKAEPSAQQACMSYLSLCGTVGEATIGFMLSLVLLKANLLFVMTILVGLSFVSLAVSLKLYKMVKRQ